VQPASDAPDPLIGRTIAGKFAIETKLGQGAMGAVYRARQITLDKAVAIKVLHGDRANDPSYAERFRREAKAASRLDHPNSIRVFDFGQEPDGLLYLAMEYVEGRDLRSLLPEIWPLPAAAVADIVAQVLSALAVAHDLGVLHRDLKPENVMVVRAVGDDGAPVDVVKVCDFGIAKIIEAPRASGSGRRTTEGFIVGTPEYMSPEQARGEAIDGRSDLYSVGVVLYELLTGQAPFEGDAPLSIVLKHLSDAPVPPRTLRPDVDAALEAICLKALQKYPGHRYPNAREMRQALRQAAGADDASRSNLVLPRPRVSSARPYRATVDVEKSTLRGVAPAAPATPRGARPARLATVAIAAVAAVVLAGAVLVRQAETPAAPRLAPSAPSPRGTVAAQPPATTMTLPSTTSPAMTQSATPLVPAVADRPAMRESRVRRVKAATTSSPGATTNAEPVVEEPAVLAPAPPPEAAPIAAAAAGPAPVPPLAAEVAAAAPIAVAPQPAVPFVPQVAPPAYDVGAASVEIGLARSAIGATSSSVTRTVSEASGAVTACYRAALPRLTGTIDGPGTLHVETDGEGVIIDVRATGPFDGGVARCIASALNGRRVANVDTGSARADVPLTFRAR
jgi:serine/threonine-protein kinase